MALVREVKLLAFDGFPMPTTGQERAAAKESFDALPPAEREMAVKQGPSFWSFLVAFSIYSVMVHWVKQTALMPKSVSGDEESDQVRRHEYRVA
ncbi:MAG: hypothetical protein Q7S85_04715 [Rugosibacter sp.]|nr:hypothetical protein [Rugosibacter sp.]